MTTTLTEAVKYLTFHPEVLPIDIMDYFDLDRQQAEELIDVLIDERDQNEDTFDLMFVDESENANNRRFFF